MNIAHALSKPSKTTRPDLSVSNSSSRRHRELDQALTVGDPTHVVKLGTSHRTSAGKA